MRALRLLLVGVLAITAMVAGLFAVAVIILTGLTGYVAQLFWRRPGSVRSRPTQGPSRQSSMRTDDVIDVIATKVPAERIEN